MTPGQPGGWNTGLRNWRSALDQIGHLLRCHDVKEAFGKLRLLADALGEFGRSLTAWDDPDDGWEDFVLALFDPAAPVCLVGMAAVDHASGILGVAVNFDEVGVGVLRAEYIQMGIRTQPHTLTVPIDVLAPAV